MFKWRNQRAAAAAGILFIAAAGCEYSGYNDDSSLYDVDLGQIQFDAPTPLPSAGEAGPTDVIALSQPATEVTEWLNVESPAFSHGQPIPERYSGWGRNDLPALKWSDVPEGTQSFVVIVEDPDARAPRPFVHMVLYNVPGKAQGITGQDVHSAQANDMHGPMLGRNSSGTLGYVAPAPPMGEASHTYHFQVFALDTTLNLPAGAEKQAVINAMQGHVLAKGETIGTFQRQ